MYNPGGLLTLDPSLILALAQGGTSAPLVASNGGIVYSTGTALAILSGTATAGQMLRSGASGAPAWSTATYPATVTANRLLWASATNVIADLATANDGVLITSGAGVPSISSTLPNAVQDLITRTGTITSGVWSAGAVTSSGLVTANGAAAGHLELASNGNGVTAYLANKLGAQIYYSNSGGTAPFDQNGNLIFQPRTSVADVFGFAWATASGGSTTPTTKMTLSSAGVLTVNGFGTHTFIAGGTGTNRIHISNTTDGTGNYADVLISAGTTTNYLRSFSQSYTTSGWAVASGLGIYAGAAGGISLTADHASGAIRFYSGGTTLRAQINTNGTQTWAPYGAGTATFDASGNITSVSDARFKDRIAPLPYGLSEVLQLRPVQHGYNALSGLEREHLYGGFLAQDVQAVMPLAVGVDARGYLTLADRPILGAVVTAIQTLDARLAVLEARQD